MRRILFGSILLLAVNTAAIAEDFSLKSPEVKDGGVLSEQQVYEGFGCKGGNTSPELTWSGAPEGTKSLALTVYDPDAPTGSGWWHWVIYNIPAEVSKLARNAGNPAAGLAPAGSVQGVTDYGTRGFGGACPPVGDKPHRYIFTPFALKTPKLELPLNATSAFVGFNLNANSLGKTGFTATYGR